MNNYSIIGLVLLHAVAGCTSGPSPPKSPREEQKSFQLASGLRIELVASEPMVQDPVVMTFDEDGRLWVAEMRGFMVDVDGTGETDPVGRISVLTDSDQDGKMDESIVFLDSLVLPRAIALVQGGLLVAEKMPLWYVQDLDGDFKADRKTLIDSTYGENGMVEHSPNGLWRGMDNWFYNAKSSKRYRPEGGRWIKEETEFRGQWGISHDNYGRLYYNYNWSQLHADLVPPNYFNRNPYHTPTSGIDHGLTLDRQIFPARPNPAANRGYIEGTLDDTGRLREFTSACSPFVYRGVALSEEFQGNVFVCEPVGNLIKRNLISEEGLLLQAKNAYPNSEFLASTDERFRPVSLTSGPDGALYIADMYRGIVEHAPYISEYLRDQILKRKLDRPINQGRIWRIVPNDFVLEKTPGLSSMSSKQLVNHLSHPDGWHRDAAQRLLVQAGDTSVSSELVYLATQGANSLGRLHALWTLEGLKYPLSDVFLDALSDQDPQNRVVASRILESRVNDSDQIRLQLQSHLSQNWENEPPQVVLQTALAASVFDEEVSFTVLAGISKIAGDSALIIDAVLSSLYDREYPFLQYILQSEEWQKPNPGAEILLESLAMIISRKAEPEELTGLLSLISRSPKNLGWQEKAILNGMALQGMQMPKETVELAGPPDQLTETTESDPTLSGKITQASNLFDWPGKTSPVDRKDEIVLDETSRKQFALGRQHYLSGCAGCHGSNGEGMNRLAPPLIESEWVLGDELRLALLLLHGIEGPIAVNGRIYDAPDILPQMPSHSTLGNNEIEAIMTYIRNEWGHNAGPVEPHSVGGIRVRSQGRVQPWTAAELNAYIEPKM